MGVCAFIHQSLLHHADVASYTEDQGDTSRIYKQIRQNKSNLKSLKGLISHKIYNWMNCWPWFALWKSLVVKDVLATLKDCQMLNSTVSGSFWGRSQYHSNDRALVLGSVLYWACSKSHWRGPEWHSRSFYLIVGGNKRFGGGNKHSLVTRHMIRVKCL